ncbi:TIGR02117 family protein [Hoeflea prorocentri]|uniref:TIGR02117 family protein n=1 Tax=Hoeflea prorocentri TaxID=1922333 RepID=A0A9X3UKP0_9HYPH|nr:TIGR02117 family protein [Hoeflea prorocentri]MCY6380676.1 TIGR02117 family protein [Hoeflea prorocentri]MDA5398476.1 TIGR02117 family protein [Hoeflea prorocentri]
MSDWKMSSRSFTRRFFKAVAITTATVLAIITLYLAAAIAGTVWTVPGKSPASTPVHTVYVLSNGFHSDIALPVIGGRAPANVPVQSDDLPHGLEGARYLVFGWGSQTAYTSLLALSDLTASIIVRSLAFDRSVIHVLPLPVAPHGLGVFRVDLDNDQYERLVRFIAASFDTDMNGDVELLDGVTQGFGDVFYRATGRFNPFYGCNAWTGQALRQAGVEVGYWTPFAQSIEWNMNRIQSAD